MNSLPSSERSIPRAPTHPALLLVREILNLDTAFTSSILSATLASDTSIPSQSINQANPCLCLKELSWGLLSLLLFFSCLFPSFILVFQLLTPCTLFARSCDVDPHLSLPRPEQSSHDGRNERVRAEPPPTSYQEGAPGRARGQGPEPNQALWYAHSHAACIVLERMVSRRASIQALSRLIHHMCFTGSPGLPMPM